MPPGAAPCPFPENSRIYEKQILALAINKTDVVLALDHPLAKLNRCLKKDSPTRTINVRV